MLCLRTTILGLWMASAIAVGDVFTDIQTKYNEMSYELHAGYPMCEDVFERKRQEMREKLELRMMADFGGDRDLAKTVAAQLTSPEAFPSQLQLAEHASFSDQPAHPTRRPRREAAGSLSDSFTLPNRCFEGKTKVCRLDMAVREPKMKLVPIADLKRSDLVLSSTQSMIEDPRYQLTCWGEVTDVVKGKVHNDEPYRRIRYQDAHEKKGLLRVTPLHRFWSRAKTRDSWSWRTAQELSTGDELYSLEDGIATVTESVEMLGKGAERNYRDGFIVYNLTIHNSHTYFVFPNTRNCAGLLVHNIK